MRLSWILACGLALAFTVGCGDKAKDTGTTKRDPVTHDVSMVVDNKFSPAAISIKVGDKVRWTNKDEVIHDATREVDPEKFASGNVAAGKTFEHTFTTEGTFEYWCKRHRAENMKGTVTVAK
jgi:plastocyanin